MEVPVFLIPAVIPQWLLWFWDHSMKGDVLKFSLSQSLAWRGVVEIQIH